MAFSGTQRTASQLNGTTGRVYSFTAKPAAVDIEPPAHVVQYRDTRRRCIIVVILTGLILNYLI